MKKFEVVPTVVILSTILIKLELFMYIGKAYLSL